MTEYINKYILFYSRNKEYGWLSNFERATQMVDGLYYQTNEHYYQSQKGKTERIRFWIRSAPNPFLAMKAGRSLRKKEIIPYWDAKKLLIMKKGLRAKFDQNSLLAKKLLATGNATLHENSPTDMFWGIKGKDMLGKLLMQVRGELKNGL